VAVAVNVKNITTIVIKILQGSVVT